MSIELGKQVEKYRKAAGLTMEELADKLGYKSKSSIKHIESGLTDLPQSKIEQIAEVFGISPSDLTGWHAPSAEKPRLKGIKIPVLGRVQAGMPVEAMQEILDYEEITERMASTGDFFGLYVRGESMMPDFKPGDIVIVRQQPDADNGDIVIASINGDDATIKKFKRTPTGIALIPLNEAFQTLYYNYQQIEELPVRIVGKVVELRRSL